MEDNRVVCLNCMDGRVQLPVIDWIKNHYNVDYVDMITEPGIDGILADTGQSIEHIDKKINISIEKNSASMIFVVGHFDCKGNPVNEAAHKKHILLAVERVKNGFAGLDVIGMWVNPSWSVEKLEG